MQPNEILPAITRQKVKYHDGRIAHVLNVGADGKRVAVMTINPANLDEWTTEFCEPVPEEPRPLRIGDAVALHISGTDEVGPSQTFGRIIWIHDGEDGRLQYGTEGGCSYADGIRLATPQELKDYFPND